MCPANLQSSMCKLFFFSPEGKGEPWHPLTCQDYVTLAVIEWLAFLQEMLVVCVLCSDRAVALLISTSPPVNTWACFCAFALVAWEAYFNTPSRIGWDMPVTPSWLWWRSCQRRFTSTQFFSGKSSFGIDRVAHLKEEERQFAEDWILREAV